MSISNPFELRNFLAQIGAHPKKSLSQNFLIDSNIVEKILNSAKVTQGEHVLEIGPGPGALTEALMKRGAKVIAVEKDRSFAKALHRFSGVEVIEGDILDFSFDSISSGTKVISNLPYHLTSPILTHLLPQRERFSTLTLMMQKEVAERILSKPGSKSYGSLTLFAQFYADVQDHFIVKASCFFPRPKVDSMVLTFRLRDEIPLKNPNTFFDFVHLFFQKRRKMIRGVLLSHYGQSVLSFLEKGSINLNLRPEVLSLTDFLYLYSCCESY